MIRLDRECFIRLEKSNRVIPTYTFVFSFKHKEKKMSFGSSTENALKGLTSIAGFIIVLVIAGVILFGFAKGCREALKDKNQTEQIESK